MKKVVFHLGSLKRSFNNGKICEGSIENGDEMQFVVNLDTGKTLGFIVKEHVKYADVVSGREPMIIMVLFFSDVYANIHHPIIVFQNRERTYPTSEVADYVAGVCDQCFSKGWMDGVQRKKCCAWFHVRLISCRVTNKELCSWIKVRRIV